MPDFLNQIQIKGSTYNINDSRLAENGGAIVAAETIYVSSKADGNALTTASQVASAISSAISSIAIDRISNAGGMLSVDSSGDLSTSGVGGIYLAADDITLQGQGGGQSLTMDDASGAVSILATAFTYNGENIATEPFVSSAINSALTSTMTYKGAISVATVPTGGAKVGDVYVANSNITAITAEPGDMVVFKASVSAGTSITTAIVDVIQKNLDGAVKGPSSATPNHVVAFLDTTGKTIKDTGYTIAKSVPSDAIFTDANVLQTSSLSVLSSSYPMLFKASTDNADTTGAVAFNSAITYNPGMSTFTIDGGITGLTAGFQTLSNVTTFNGVEVPANPEFTDTTYSAGSGLSLSGTTINHTNSITAGSAGISTAQSGTTFSVPYVAYDAQGHITSAITAAVTIPVMGGATTQAPGTAGLVPAASAGHENEFLRADGQWSAPTFTIPAADSTTLGGIKLGYSTDASLGYYAVQVDDIDNKAYVSVLPYGAGEGLSFASSDWSFNVISATSSTFGGIKLGYTESPEDGYFAVQLDDNNKAYVHAYSIGDGLSLADGILSVPTFSGATSQATGTAGLVPAAASSQYATAFLKADGTWAETATVSGNTLIL